jgi:transcriptional regulator with XRE-family HTH domain
MPNTPRLREWRERAALSQEGLEARSGVTRHTISNLERGVQRANPKTVRKLAEALGVEPGDLYGEVSRHPLALEPPTLEAFLRERCGSSWLALPDNEWECWYWDLSYDEGAERFNQIDREYRTIKQEWKRARPGVSAVFTPGGTQQELERLRDLFVSCWRRWFRAAEFEAPLPDEPPEKFEERSAEHRPADEEEKVDSTVTRAEELATAAAV